MAEYEDAFCTELHRERRVRRGGDAAGDEVHHRQPAVPCDLANHLERRLQLLGRDEQLVVAHGGEAADFGVDGADVADCLHDVAGAGLALGSHHRCALADPA